MIRTRNLVCDMRVLNFFVNKNKRHSQALASDLIALVRWVHEVQRTATLVRGAGNSQLHGAPGPRPRLTQIM